MIFSLDVRRARKGDCLLLHFGSREKPGLAIIDGGPSQVYGPYLRPRLVEIRTARNLDKQKPLPVDLLMVSHADDDHIQGILDLTREMMEKTGPPLLRVLRFWQNSFEDIIGKDPSAVTSQFGAASRNSERPEEAFFDSDQDDEVILGGMKVLASIEQGQRLRGDAGKLGFPPNKDFGGKPILAAMPAAALGGGLSFVVAGPMRKELEELRKKHQQWLKSLKDQTAEESLAAYVDKSVTNLSSIVALAKCEGKTMLLTGDARGDKILEGLELVGALPKGGSMRVDVLKIPHHGSSNNIDSDFFERITAAHYVFSGDGEHGNPERETMRMLFAARGDEPFTIRLTYPVDLIDAARQADWEKEQAKEVNRKARGSQKPVRENWSAAQHGLAAFFENTKLAPGQEIRIVDAGAPHVIDLLEPLGY